MQAMAMTIEEKQKFMELQSDVHELKNEVKEIRDNWMDLNAKVDRILSIVKGIAIGIAIGAVVFGVLSIKDLVNVVK